MFKIEDGREAFWQWDTNQKLIIENDSLTEVHFCNKTDDCSLVCEIYEDNGQRVVDVPNILLQNDWPIRAYAYQVDHTLIERKFKVNTRTKPADYVYTETEVKTWDRLAEEIENSIAAFGEAEAERVEAEAAREEAEAKRNNDFSTLANGLKGAETGAAVALNDISPNEHELKVKVRSKNILPYPYVNTTITKNGITFTDNGDGSITINGTSEVAFISFSLCTSGINLINGVIYSLSKNTKPDEVAVYFKYKKPDGTIGWNLNNTVWEEGCIFEHCFIQVEKEGVAFDNFTIYPQIVIGNTPTTYTPYVADISKIKVKQYGKNLLPYPYTNTTKTEAGVTFTDNGDGSIKLSGTATGYSMFAFGTLTDLAPNTQYCFSGFGDSVNIIANLTIRDANKTAITTLAANPLYLQKEIVFNTADYPEAKYFDFMIKRNNNIETSGTIKPVFEVGSTPTAYEEYKEPVIYTVSADGTAEGVIGNGENITLTTDTVGAVMDIEYNKDINKAFAELQQAIISLGGNV